ncbi:hypothetical protein [Desulforhopalus singaporensis]|uniref:Uncharacterized protein n=1 Tax=Desulforhopalus singaporensis TaxID=91360 RepID=A0A1H0KHA9_9BACT|nr:hypothetical protein [Desulforhopalus singaporensis]SDO55206.1 hypothetical protein SAMN05660330_00498 [Desulforhopalus singaporensis]
MGNSKQLKIRGILMLLSFFIVLMIIFLPLLPGAGGKKVNGLDYLDNFFNELSKGSAYHIDKQLEDAAHYTGSSFNHTLIMDSPQQALLAANMLNINNLPATVQGGVNLTVDADFGQIMTTILRDADTMYHNNGQAITDKYGVDEMSALYSWYRLQNAMAAKLTGSGAFAQAKFVKKSMTKGVEPAYNYYKVEVKPVREEIFLLIAALVFYVAYTIWYGFGLLYIFEGLGIKIKH